MTYTTEQYWKKVTNIFGDEYDLVGEFKGITKRVEIKHNKCGKTYTPVARDLMTGRGCSHCYGRKRLSQSTAFKQIYDILGEEYEILSSYKNSITPLDIIHKKCGTKYKASHNNITKTFCSCPNCNIKSRGEELIKHFLNNNNIDFETEKRFEDCRNVLPLPFDFYLSKYNILIEYQGEQHYKPRKKFGGEEGFKNTVIRDNIKKQYCKNNNIKLIEIPYTEIKNIGDILTKELKLG